MPVEVQHQEPMLKSNSSRENDYDNEYEEPNTTIRQDECESRG